MTSKGTPNIEYWSVPTKYRVCNLGKKLNTLKNKYVIFKGDVSCN